MKLIVNAINAINAGRTRGAYTHPLLIDVDMSEAQMMDALGEFLKKVTDADWARWKEHYDADTETPKQEIEA